MKKFLRSALAFFLVLNFAQTGFAQTTGFSGTGGNIDVNYYRCDWYIDPSATKAISGTVTIYFTTVQPNVSSISIDLRKSAFSNPSLVVKYHGSTTGVTKSFPSSGIVDILNIGLPVTLPNNKLDSISITYAGNPPAQSGEAVGYQKDATYGYIWTLSESYEDRDWWPCKADMQDKADSMDIIITCPSANVAVTNGALISNTVNGANRTVYYKTRYPTASYLVAVNVGPYTTYDRGTVNIGGTNVPVSYTVATAHSTGLSARLTAMDYCKDELVAFSSKFGDYPFKNDKYAMVEFGFGGGMEHQSISGMSWNAMSDWGTIAHELMHQWFGDKVTFGTWNDLWLAEGFANYGEVLAAELVPAIGANPVTVRTSARTTATNTTYRTFGCILPNSVLTNSTTLWDSEYGTTVYKRGCMVVSMLRKLAGDTKFFQACRNYLNDPALAYKSATTNDLKAHFEAVLGMDLDPFFDAWVSGGGYPTYSVKWGNNSKRVNIEMSTQTRNYAPGTTTYFPTPVVVKIGNGTKDTTVVIYDQGTQVSFAGNGIQGTRAGKVLSYNLSFVPTTVTLDPDAEMLATGSVTADHARLDAYIVSLLDVKIIDFKGTKTDNGNLLSLLVDPTSNPASISLERSSNGTQFHAIGEMTNHVSTAAGLLYNFLDVNISDRETFYYRVKATDDQGVITYSNIISLGRRNEQGEWKLRPNPADKYVKLVLPASWLDKTASYEIYSANGLSFRKGQTKAGSAEVSIDTDSLPAGLYIIELKNSEGRKESKSFTVIH